MSEKLICPFLVAKLHQTISQDTDLNYLIRARLCERQSLTASPVRYVIYITQSPGNSEAYEEDLQQSQWIEVSKHTVHG